MGRVNRTRVIAVALGALGVALTAGSALTAGGTGTAGSAAGAPGTVPDGRVRLPGDVPVHVCGETVDAVGLLDRAAGAACPIAGEDDPESGGEARREAGREADREDGRADATAGGGERDSPGGGSGVGDASVPGSGGRPQPPPRRPARPEPSALSRPSVPSVLSEEHEAAEKAAADLTDPRATSAAFARAGADGTVPALVGGTALVLGGALLFRRFGPVAGDRPTGTGRVQGRADTTGHARSPRVPPAVQPERAEARRASTPAPRRQ